ncbi:bifunctional riboflavin kinase/FAD synthetase [Ferrimonas balearica]|uniref:bifunctional riboflavin kinase/FAD synthetase n=1 Tax=Ferrimonas balearica TaxID=44012 RepID=UPI001C99B718|nr:bifunctional riboflavin kinase/FAD synthetase [Ferrimonas balearica]MBY5993436.1 bifunctional riboflavin kinase/FAD synthetase [Ferrimonas balearica]
MELIRGIHNLSERHRGCVLTIGNFDGVHRGHAEVIRRLVALSRQYGVPATVMVFEPQPQEYFLKEKAPARLNLLRDKLDRLAELGVDRVLCVRFDQRFAQWEAEDFVQQLLVQKLGIRYLVVGDDFCFGRGRRGNFPFLQRAGEQHGFAVEDTASCRLGEERISSTLIRNALAEGDLVAAERMLGHPYQISGRVAHGDKLGRTIGFPTANILLKRTVVPVSGVYAVRVQMEDGRWHHGVANVGKRPTLSGQQCRLEVHLFDFDADLYGQHLHVRLHAWLRDEHAFASLEALKAQIQLDAQNALEALRVPEHSENR